MNVCVKLTMRQIQVGREEEVMYSQYIRQTDTQALEYPTAIHLVISLVLYPSICLVPLWICEQLALSCIVSPRCPPTALQNSATKIETIAAA